MRTDASLAVMDAPPPPASMIAALAAIPEEDVWLAKQKSAGTRRAYRLDVEHFMRTVGIISQRDLRKVDHRAVIAWERHMRDVEKAASSTIRRRLSALSSLFKHLIQFGHARRNPAADVARPAINRTEGTTLAFSKADAGRILNLPPADTIQGLRDRAILSVGLQVGLRRAEISALTVGDLHQNRGYDSLRVVRKGGRREALAIHQQTAARIRAYLEAAGHGGEFDEALFRPLRKNRVAQEKVRFMHPDAIDRAVRKYAQKIGLARGYSAHSMPAKAPRRSKTARNSKTCRRPQATATQAPRSCTTAAATTRRKRQASLRRTERCSSWSRKNLNSTSAEGRSRSDESG